MCSIGASVSANELEITIHDVCVHEAEGGMLKGSREAAGDFETE
jgi:hypothetical protein